MDFCCIFPTLSITITITSTYTYTYANYHAEASMKYEEKESELRNPRSSYLDTSVSSSGVAGVPQAVFQRCPNLQVPDDVVDAVAAALLEADSSPIQRYVAREHKVVADVVHFVQAGHLDETKGREKHCIGKGLSSTAVTMM